MSNVTSSSLVAPFEITRLNASAPILLVCEHASNFIPLALIGLGLTSEEQATHIAWDIGALDLAKAMSDNLDATLIAATQSRLIYDCNRAPNDPSAMPDTSEIYTIIGNADLPDVEKDRRISTIYAPFHDAIDDIMHARITSGSDLVLVSMHTFTPIYRGQQRATEIGLVFAQDSRIASKMLSQAMPQDGLMIVANDPYGPEDGVFHTMERHGLAKGILHIMIEVRNDLVSQPDQVKRVAAQLCNCLEQAMVAAAPRQESRSA